MRRAPSDVYRSVGRRIAELRRLAGLTQKMLGERLDYSETYLRRIEGGRQNVTLKTLTGIANALAVDVGEFFALSRPERGRKRRSVT